MFNLVVFYEDPSSCAFLDIVGALKSWLCARLGDGGHAFGGAPEHAFSKRRGRLHKHLP